MKRLTTLLLVVLGFISTVSAQEKDSVKRKQDHFIPHLTDTYKPMKISLSEDGWQYLRFLTWHQVWAEFNENSEGNIEISPRIRRSRVLMAMQMSPRFLMVTHWGLNNLSADNMDGLGQGRGAQIFMHDAWVEYTIAQKNLYIGGGLHYWNGISRLTSSTTLTTVTMDGPLFNWPTVNRSGQFARHLGIYAKGALGKLLYRVSVNEPIIKNEAFNDERGVDVALQVDNPIYKTKKVFNGEKANVVYQGYFTYQFLDEESNKYPYMVGTYMGKKKVLNVGAGFFSHPDGTVSLDTANSLTDTLTHNVNLFGVDVYYDAPLGKGALSTYLVYYDYDFGPRYAGGASSSSQTVATGKILYGHTGYLLPKFSEKIGLMPYVSYAYKDFERYDDVATTLGIGTNLFVNSHHAKITFEYLRNKSATTRESSGTFRIQGMVFL